MRHITHYINPKLADIYRHVASIEKIQALVLHFLPVDMKEHCSVGSFRNGCLVLVTTDSVWASQLHFILPTLRDKLRGEAKVHQLASIKVSVNGELNLSHPITKLKPTSSSPWQAILKLLKGAPKAVPHEDLGD